jgi:phospholipid transport system substrate-binding protein
MSQIFRFNYLKKFALFLLLFIFITTFSFANEPSAEAFIVKLSNEAKTIVNNKALDEQSRLKKIEELCTAYIDLDKLANYTLGDFKDKITATQKENFNKLFKQYFVKSISLKLNDFADQELKIKDSKKVSDVNIVVNSSIFSKKDGQELMVDWRIYFNGSSLKVLDLVVEGLSLARTQKEEFASILASKSFDELIKILQTKNSTK